MTKLLTSALSHSSSDARVASVAERIESHLFEVHSAADVPYRHHARALIAHLQDAKNAQLREDVLSGQTLVAICFSCFVNVNEYMLSLEVSFCAARFDDPN